MVFGQIESVCWFGLFPEKNLKKTQKKPENALSRAFLPQTRPINAFLDAYSSVLEYKKGGVYSKFRLFPSFFTFLDF